MMALLCGMLVGLGVLLVRPRAVAGRQDRRRVRAVRAGGRPENRTREVVEAVATWTDQLRDTISASGGLLQAIAATETLAPTAIRGEVRRLVSDLKYGELEAGLRRFADSVAHPSCDFVVAALITAHRHHARDLAELLSHLAECARDESRVHLRIWVGRARLRSAMRIVKVVIVAFVTGLVALDPAYLLPFTSPHGALVLAVILADFVGALWLMNRLGERQQNFRFVGRRIEVAA